MNKPASADMLTRAMGLHQAGNLGEAETLYKKLLASYPKNSDVLYLSGTLQFQRGNLAESLSLLNKATAINPRHAETLNNRGSVLNQLKRYEEALSSYDKAIEAKPDYAEAYYNKANVLNQLKRYDEALASYDKALAFNPASADTHNNRGNALVELKRYAEALVSFDKAVAIIPRYAEAYSGRGIALNLLKRYEEAIASYDIAITLKPHYAEAYYNRGLALHNAQRYAQALASHDKAIALKPDYAEAYSDRGVALTQLRRHGEALESYDKAIALKADYASAYNNRGATFSELQRHDEALASYAQAITINPELADAHYNKSLVKLALGEYEEGWKLYEWRWKSSVLGSPKAFGKPQWRGSESLAGKTILLHAEQGQGDTIQFCRYVPMVGASGAKIVLDVPALLIDLMSTLKAPCQIAEYGVASLPEFDFHCSLMSLPRAFGTTLENIPSEPYLFATPEFISKWKPVLDEKLGTQKLRAGLCWAGGQRPDRPDCVAIDARRSMHFNTLKPLFDLRHVSFVSLQVDLPRYQLDDARVADISSGLKSWSDTAAVISMLDLVITVDTSVCHLAGAMGKKTWLLNRYDTCWRWLLDRDDSPWYPTLTQFRQKAPGDWDEVIARMKKALELTASQETL